MEEKLFFKQKNAYRLVCTYFNYFISKSKTWNNFLKKALKTFSSTNTEIGNKQLNLTI